ncbi:MAG: superoxide dismutase [Planctomycetota bacterium]
MAFTLPELAFAPAALEPHIDGRTMEIHHGKHHAGYVSKANAALEGTDWADRDVLEVIAGLSEVPADKQGAVRNNAGGHANHTLFWSILAPEGKGGEPSAELAKAIDDAFGSMDAFKKQFADAGATRFGSGWAWLCAGPGGLHVMSTANQDNPVMPEAFGGQGAGHTPILGLDVWEHAYYLNYQNRRPDYIGAFWNVVNWNAVSERFAAAK